MSCHGSAFQIFDNNPSSLSLDLDDLDYLRIFSLSPPCKTKMATESVPSLSEATWVVQADADGRWYVHSLFTITLLTRKLTHGWSYDCTALFLSFYRLLCPSCYGAYFKMIDRSTLAPGNSKLWSGSPRLKRIDILDTSWGQWMSKSTTS